MTATIKVHALSRAGFFAKCHAAGREFCASDTSPECSPERAAKRCALRVAGLHAGFLDEDSFEATANRIGLELTHLNSTADEEIFRLTFSPPEQVDAAA